MHSIAPGTNDLRSPRTHLGQMGELHTTCLRHRLSLRPTFLGARRPALRCLTIFAFRSRASPAVSKSGRSRLSLSFCLLLTAILLVCFIIYPSVFPLTI